MFARLSLVVLIAACGGTSDPPPAGVDATPGVDAPPPTVQTVTCGSEVMTIESTGGFRFMPNAATISVGQVVKFVNGPSHSIVPTGANADSGFKVGFGATACLMFTEAGTFTWRCNPHTSMTGTITVN
jgi:plastocyanin